MNKNQINFEELLKNIYDDKALIEKEKIEISKNLEEINNLKQTLENDNNSLKTQEQEIIANAKLQARNILLEAKEDVNSIIKQINSTSNNKNLEKTRNLLNDKIRNLNDSNKNYSDTENSQNNLDLSDIVPNAKVFVTTLGNDGVVLSHVSKSNEVQVQVGSLKLNVNIKDLRKSTLNDNKSSAVKNTGYSNISKIKNVKSEINVIGLNVEEAVFVIDKFLDDASIAKLQTVRIVHGKGTGKLRTRYSSVS